MSMNFFEAVRAIDEGKVVISNEDYIYKKICGKLFGKRKNSDIDYRILYISSTETEFEIYEPRIQSPFEVAISALKNGKKICCEHINRITYFYHKDDLGLTINIDKIINGKWYICNDEE